MGVMQNKTKKKILHACIPLLCTDRTNTFDNPDAHMFDVHFYGQGEFFILKKTNSG
jgi:hypothetical protein